MPDKPVWERPDSSKLETVLNYAYDPNYPSDQNRFRFRQAACSGWAFEQVYRAERATNQSALPDLDELEIMCCAAWAELAFREHYDPNAKMVNDGKLVAAIERQKKSGPSG